MLFDPVLCFIGKRGYAATQCVSGKHYSTEQITQREARTVKKDSEQNRAHISEYRKLRGTESERNRSHNAKRVL